MPTKTFSLDGPVNLHGRIGHGSFIVAAQDGLTEATVTLTPRSEDSDLLERTTVEMRGNVLAIVMPRQGGIFELGLLGGRSRQRDALDITVTVPSGTAVKITGVTADITVTGRSGSADIASGSSTISLGEVDGDLRLRYGSGTARVGSVSGSVEARSGSGDAMFGPIGGALSAGCGSGNLEVTSVRGAVRSRAGSGTASLGAVYSDVDVARGSGSIAIGLPAGQPARLDVTTGSGRVESDLPIEDAPTTQHSPITVRARTGSGNVRLFRAA
ncbi:MAG: DUF4097 family beta strand repeat-containing protein [Pseudonocardiales bacterium]